MQWYAVANAFVGTAFMPSVPRPMNVMTDGINAVPTNTTLFLMSKGTAIIVGTASMPSVPRPMNVMTDGINAVRAKTYECNDGRHKCRPYEIPNS